MYYYKMAPNFYIGFIIKFKLVIYCESRNLLLPVLNTLRSSLLFGELVPEMARTSLPLRNFSDYIKPPFCASTTRSPESIKYQLDIIEKRHDTLLLH